jgi:OOP family OmpA-OmpF porin
MSSFTRASRTVALISLLALPGVALPQDIPGWYLGFGIGQSTFKGTCCDDTDTAGKIFGGYQFSRNFDLEGAYVDLGQGKAGNVTFGATGFEGTGVGMLPLGGSGLSALARGGLFIWKAELKAPGASTDATGTSLTYGLGLKFDFNRDFSARVEWQRYKDVGDVNKTNQADIDFLGASFLYRL